MSELADDADLKSADCEVVWVRVPLSPPHKANTAKIFIKRYPFKI